MDVLDNLTLVAINTVVVTVEPNVSEGVSDNLIEVNTINGYADFTKKNNLMKTIMSQRNVSLTIPVLEAVSIATLALGSTLR